jgi:hypothetical protein
MINNIRHNWKLYSFYYAVFFSLLVVIIHILNFHSFARDGVFLLFWPVMAYLWLEFFALTKSKSKAVATENHHIKSAIAKVEQSVNWDWDSLANSDREVK